MKIMIAVLAVVLVLASLAGCTETTTSPSPTTSTVTTTTTATTTPTSSTTTTTPPNPTLSILTPQEGAQVWTGNVTVTVEVKTFDLVLLSGLAKVPGRGHIIYYLDVIPPTAPGQLAVTAPGTYAATTSTSYTWNIASRGVHLLSAELVNNDNTPLDPPVVASVTVNARVRPQLEILEPPAGSSLANSDIMVIISATNASGYQLIYYRDAEPPLAPGQPAVTEPGTYAVSGETSYLWRGVPAGNHIFAVQVVNSDLTPLEPPVTVSVSFSVGSGQTTTVPPNLGYFFGPAGIDILDIAVAGDGTTIYVAARANASTRLVYKSTDRGTTWTDLSQAPGLNIAVTSLIAVAPDNPDIVVVADMNASAACVTIDGGISWASIGPITGIGGAADQLYDLDISAQSAGVRYVACAAALDTGDSNEPALFYFNLGSAVPAWRDAVRDSRGVSSLGASEIDAIRAIRFSPAFPSDGTLLAVSEQKGSSTEDGALRFHALNLTGLKWDDAAGFTGYPVTLATSSGISFFASRVSLSLDPDYEASDETRRIVFVGAQVTDGTAHRELGGIYRLDDTTVSKILDAPVYSVAFDGTNLAAGATTDGAGAPSNAVYYSLDPLAASPTFVITPDLKRPGGRTGVIVAWAGADIVAGTSGSGSAFSISKNNGLSFNDIALIDP
jgi:hypothetical protein